MQKILISACFLANPVRYDGTAYDIKNKVSLEALSIISCWQDQGRLLAICPEMSGGLPVPRPAAEIIQTEGVPVKEMAQAKAVQVQTQSWVDVSSEFIRGAERALALCQAENIKLAVLTESSPSCGSSWIYDGQFSRSKIPGEGVTTALLRKHGIQVFGQFELSAADHYLKSMDWKYAEEVII